MNVLTNKLKYLIKISLNKKIKTKWFAIVNILLVALIVCLINIDSIITAFGGDFSTPTDIYVKDNTNEMFDIFNSSFDQTQKYVEDFYKVNIKKTEEERDKLIEDIEDNKKIIIVIDQDPNSYIKAEIISN